MSLGPGLDEAEAIGREIDNLLLAVGDTLARTNRILRDRIVPEARRSLKSTQALGAQSTIFEALAQGGLEAMYSSSGPAAGADNDDAHNDGAITTAAAGH